MRFLVAIYFAALLDGQQIEFLTLQEGVLEHQLQLASPRNPERYSQLKTLFENSGCKGDLYHEQRVKGSKEPNMICGTRGAGEHPRKIIVGAHFDSVDKGE